MVDFLGSIEDPSDWSDADMRELDSLLRCPVCERLFRYTRATVAVFPLFLFVVHSTHHYHYRPVPTMPKPGQGM